MNHLKIHEWQEMELKKDIEEISKAVRRRDYTWMAICCQALLSSVAIIWNYCDDGVISSRGILIVLLVVSIVFPFLLILPAALDYGKTLRKVNRGWRNIKGFVDEFDNRICYWTMMSQEYLKLIEHPDEEKEKELNKFYIQEANFYINKALNGIGAMQINVKGIFSDEPKDIVQNKKIDVQRLKVVIENLQRLRENGNNILNKLGDEEFKNQQNEINKQYDQRIGQFILVYNKIYFKIPIEWKAD